MSYINVSESDLAPVVGPRLSPRGQSLEITYCRASCGTTYIYKLQKPSALLPDALSAMTTLVAWRLDLAADERAWLDVRAAWPRHVVVSGHRVLGVLVPVAPPRFWWMGQERPEPRAMSRLMYDGDRPEREYFTTAHALVRLAHAWETQNFLHGHDIVIGDVQRDNILVGVEPTASSYHIDLDGAVLAGRSAVEQVAPPLYQGDDISGYPKEVSVVTDRHRFARAAVGVLARDSSVKGLTSEIRAILSADHAWTLERMLTIQESADLDHSVTRVAREWSKTVAEGQEFGYLSDRINRVPLSPDRLTVVRPVRDGVPVTGVCTPVATATMRPAEPRKTAMPTQLTSTAQAKVTPQTLGWGKALAMMGVVLLILGVAAGYQFMVDSTSPAGTGQDDSSPSSQPAQGASVGECLSRKGAVIDCERAVRAPLVVVDERPPCETSGTGSVSRPGGDVCARPRFAEGQCWAGTTATNGGVMLSWLSPVACSVDPGGAKQVVLRITSAARRLAECRYLFLTYRAPEFPGTNQQVCARVIRRL